LPDKRRPVLILTRNEVIDRLNEIIVAPATRTIRGLTTEVVLKGSISRKCRSSAFGNKPLHGGFKTVIVGSVIRLLISAGPLIVAAVVLTTHPHASPSATSVCDLSRDLSAYRDEVVTVRGVYYYGLRQECAAKCSAGPWPSFLDLVGTGYESWDGLKEAERRAELEAKRGIRVEVWVTVKGWLRTQARHSLLGPCDKIGSRYFGYGHFGVFPARLEVLSFSDIQIKVNPASPYDYSNMYRGAA
jgi:hypothetical protein